jgi:hypothetical protein
MPPPLIADISSYDRVIDFERAKAEGGITGVIARLGLGFNGDAYFARNLVRSAEAGLPFSPYYVLFPEYDRNQQIEVLHVQLHTLGWNPRGYLIPPSPEVPNGVGNRLWIDCERTELSITQTASQTLAFLQALEAHLAGPAHGGEFARPGVYTNSSYWGSKIGNTTWARNYPLWVAHYTTAPQPIIPIGWTTYELWQYTERGAIPGYPRQPAADLSRANVPTLPSVLFRVVVGGNLRRGASTSFGVIRFIGVGETVGKTGRQAGIAPDIWYEIIDRNGVTGWIWDPGHKLVALS